MAFCLILAHYRQTIKYMPMTAILSKRLIWVGDGSVWIITEGLQLIMKVLRSLFGENEQNKSEVVRFVPRIEVSSKSTLYVQVEPRDPTTTSNIIITAFASQQNRSVLPIRVEWSRFKVRSDAPLASERIHCLAGNTYMCQPADVGGYIKAVVRSAEESVRGEAEVVVGPIGIDVMIKRVIDGALYAGSLLSQVVLCERNRKNNVTLRLNSRTMEFTDDASQEKLVREYSISEPKLELNPKDPTRVYVRFEQDRENGVREWLNRIFGVEEGSGDESSLSIRVPYSTHSSSSSKMRLFQKSQGPCPNKFQMRFISRLSRDLFLFTQRAFVCREDMKNSLIMQRVQTLQNMSTEQDYMRFLQFMSLRQEVVRLAEYAREVEEDRDAKVQDLTAMEESIGEMTLTYLKIIEEKGRHEKADFQHSYSQISHTREDILNRKHFRELKAENESLKTRLRQLNEEIDLLKFFRKDDNESMILNQTGNPFAKKPMDNSPDRSNLKGMHELSLNYATLLEQNRLLKSENRQLKGDAMGKKIPLDRSQNMIELLGTLDQHEEQEAYEAKIREYQNALQASKRENEELKKKLSEYGAKKVAMVKGRFSGHEEPSFLHNQSAVNQSVASISASSLNCSLTSDAALLRLEENLEQLTRLNQKLQEDTTRLRKERDYYRAEYLKMKDQLQNNSFADSRLESQAVSRLRTQNEQLENEKKALVRKLDSIARENPQDFKEEYMQREKKIKQLQQSVQTLKQENKRLQETQSKAPSEDTQILSIQNNKLKKINLQLIEDVKGLKVQIEQLKEQDMYSSRVIELQNQLALAKTNTAPSPSNDHLLQQLNELSKQNARLKQENQEKTLKLQHQAGTLEKLMQPRRSSPAGKPSSQSTSSKEKERCYSEKCSQATIEQLEKYKREVKKLQQEIIFIKKNSDVHNRSREFSSGMDYYQERLQIMQKELEALQLENENLSKMCERYGKDARQANRELNKCREKMMALIRSRHEESQD